LLTCKVVFFDTSSHTCIKKAIQNQHFKWL
jgi:hypothetical protein